jgi:phosphatidylglycerophosphate synthase
MAQMPLFKNMPFKWETTLFCFQASIADCIMVLLLYVGFCLIYKNSAWFIRPRFLQVVLLVIMGGLGAILAEKKHISLGNWAYSSYMPLVPVVYIGLSPLLQFMILPAIIFFVASPKAEKL